MLTVVPSTLTAVSTAREGWGPPLGGLAGDTACRVAPSPWDMSGHLLDTGPSS